MDENDINETKETLAVILNHPDVAAELVALGMASDKPNLSKTEMRSLLLRAEKQAERYAEHLRRKLL